MNPEIAGLALGRILLQHLLLLPDHHIMPALALLLLLLTYYSLLLLQKLPLTLLPFQLLLLSQHLLLNPFILHFLPLQQLLLPPHFVVSDPLLGRPFPHLGLHQGLGLVLLLLPQLPLLLQDLSPLLALLHESGHHLLGLLLDLFHLPLDHLLPLGGQLLRRLGGDQLGRGLLHHELLPPLQRLLLPQLTGLPRVFDLLLLVHRLDHFGLGLLSPAAAVGSGRLLLLEELAHQLGLLLDSPLIAPGWGGVPVGEVVLRGAHFAVHGTGHGTHVGLVTLALAVMVTGVHFVHRRLSVVQISLVLLSQLVLEMVFMRGGANRPCRLHILMGAGEILLIAVLAFDLVFGSVQLLVLHLNDKVLLIAVLAFDLVFGTHHGAHVQLMSLALAVMVTGFHFVHRRLSALEISLMWLSQRVLEVVLMIRRPHRACRVHILMGAGEILLIAVLAFYLVFGSVQLLVLHLNDESVPEAALALHIVDRADQRIRVEWLAEVFVVAVLEIDVVNRPREVFQLD